MFTHSIDSLLVAFAVLTQSPGPHDQPRLETTRLEVQAKATIERTEYHAMEPIWVRFEVTNETDVAWVVWGQDPLHLMTIEVKKDGEPVRATVYGELVSRRGFFSRRDGAINDSDDPESPRKTFRFFIGKSDIAPPGGKLSFSLPVNWVRDMTVPGEYTIRLGLPFSYDGDVKETADGLSLYTRGTARANSVTVRVTDRPKPPEDR